MVKYTCNRCNKYFDHKGTYTRHVNRVFLCTNAIFNNVNEDSKKNVIKCNNVNDELINLRNEITNLKNELKEIKNTKIVIIENVQINLVAFGNEDFSFLSEEQRKLILSKGLKGPCKYVELVHCNPEKPEYKNLKITNKKDMNKPIIYDGKQWNIDMMDSIGTVVDNSITFMEDEYDKSKGKLSQKITKIMDKFVDHVNGDNSNIIRNQISKDIKTTFYNNRNI